MANKNPKAPKIINSKNSAELERQLAEVKKKEMQPKIEAFVKEYNALCNKHGLTIQPQAGVGVAIYDPANGDALKIVPQ